MPRKPANRRQDDTTTKPRQERCLVFIYVDAWIPYPRIDHPLGLAIPGETNGYHHEFNGNVRRTPQLFGSAKMWTAVIVDMGSQDIIWSRHDTGETIGYRYELQPVPGTAPGLFGWRPKRLVEVEDRAKADTDDMNESAVANGAEVVVTINGDSHNPLIPALFSPDIDYHLTVTLEKKADGVHYRVTGTHDGFPAYSIYINDKNIYFHTPRPEGANQTPWSLISLPHMGPFSAGEFSVDRSGVVPCLHDLSVLDPMH